MMEKRGRSPSLTRKNWVEPEPIYSVVEQKKLLTSAELKKVPIYSKYTVSSLLYAQNVKRPHPSDKTIKSPARRSLDKPPPIALSSKVIMPTKTKSNEDNLSSSYTKTGSPKPEDTKKPHPRNYVVNIAAEISNNVKSHQKQPKRGLGSSKTVKLRFHDDLLSSKDDHNLTTNYEECDKLITSCPSESNEILIVEDRNIIQHLVEDLHGEIMESHQRGDKILECELLVPTSICLEAGNADDDMHQSNACSDPADYVMLVESVSSEEHLNDRNDETNQQDQACETLDVGGDHHLTRPNADKENQKEVVDIGPKVVEDEQRKEPEAKKGGDHDEAPNKEDLISKMVVAYQLQVVAHGKKDLATHNSVTEETISKLRQQRSNKVKALVGAFESVITSHEYDVLPKRLSHINKN